MNTGGVKDPDRHVPQHVWPGPHVTCTVDGMACIPTMTADGWRMPVHGHGWGDCRDMPCPGSLAGVVAPVHATMARRIEDHVVAAMPPAHHPNPIPEAKHLAPGDDPMRGPSR